MPTATAIRCVREMWWISFMPQVRKPESIVYDCKE